MRTEAGMFIAEQGKNPEVAFVIPAPLAA